MKSGQVKLELIVNPLNYTDMNFDKSLIGNRNNPTTLSLEVGSTPSPKILLL